MSNFEQSTGLSHMDVLFRKLPRMVAGAKKFRFGRVPGTKTCMIET